MTQRQAKDIFLRAIEIESLVERRAFFESECDGDPQLQRRVDALLAAHDNPDSYLERPAPNFDVTQSLAGKVAGSALSDSSSLHGRFLPGTEIADRYRIVSLLGRGGMGEVYRADDLRLGQAVALKFLPAELAKDKKRLEYFHNEVKLARQISHPNVCRVYDIGEVDGQHFISMEYIDGEDLKTLLGRIGRLPRDKGNEIAQQFCAGLAAAHSRGVLHRDLKPANVMIDGRGQVRITDFGLATVAEDGTDVVGMSGTPAYMAPEQILRGQTNIKSDIYSLGLVLFELFTGTQVHVADSLAELRRRHEESSSSRNDPGEITQDIDAATRRGIERCLSIDPADRPSSVEELAMWLPGGDPLAAALAAGETPTPEMVAAAGGDIRLPRSAVLSMAAAVLVALVIIFAFSRHILLLERFNTVLSPAALQDRTRNALVDLGNDEDLIDTAFELEVPGRSNDTDIDDVAIRSNGYFDGLWFWFRGSPSVLSGKDMDRWAQVSETDPAWQPGMTGVRMDIAGNLRWFRRVPPRVPDSSHNSTRSQSSADPDWYQWFHPKLIGFALDDLTPVDQLRNPPDHSDDVQSWQGTVPSLGEIQVMAAAIDGKPSYFEIVQPSMGNQNAALNENAELAMDVFALIVTSIFFVIAYGNITTGRGDVRAAGTFGCVSLALTFLSWVFNTHHSLSLHELDVYWLAVAAATKNGFIGFCGYLAAEPIVRRTWPGALTTWTRVVRGEAKNPRIAEDVLAGITLGAWVVVIVLILSRYYGLLRGPVGFIGGYQGGRYVFGGLADAAQHSLIAGMATLVCMSVFGLLTRSRTAGLILFAILFTPLIGNFSGLPIQSWWLRGTLPLLVVTYVCVRHGLVGVCITQMTIFILFLPITSNTSAYYFETGLVGIGIIVVLSLLAVRGALKNRHVTVRSVRLT